MSAAYPSPIAQDGDIRALYIPMRHPDSDNFDPAVVYRWLKDLVASGVRIVTLNGIYDWGWLRADGGIAMPPSDQLEEVGALATLIDENQFSYSLDALCARYGLPGKDEACWTKRSRPRASRHGVRSSTPRSTSGNCRRDIVGPYAEIDAVRTLELFETLTPIMDREGTRDAYRLEVDLLPMVLEMRRRGIRIDQDAAEQARDLLLAKRDAALAELSSQLGTPVSMDEIGRNKWKAQDLRCARHRLSAHVEGQPIVRGRRNPAGWQKHRPSAAAADREGQQVRHRAAPSFSTGHILDHIVNGRIHAEVHPHRSDEGGARSLRFSYSNPPLQQMTVTR